MKTDINFVKIFQKIIDKDYKNNYRTRKHEEILYFQEILYVLNSHTYWSRYRGPIKWKVLYNKHREYINKGYYRQLFRLILEQYTQKNTYFIFRYQSTDTSFVNNKLGVNLPRNKYYKSKRGVKISSIVDSNGVPFSLLIEDCNRHDSTLLKKVVDGMIHNPQADKYKSSNRHKQYFMADSGYDSKENIKYLEDKGYTVIIPPNRRNTKDESKLRKYSDAHKKIYKKRTIVENSFGWLKFIPKVLMVFEKKANNYLELIKLTYSQLIFNRFLR